MAWAYTLPTGHIVVVTKTTIFLLCAAGAVAAVFSRTRMKRHQRSGQMLGPVGDKRIDIGAIFGLDVGGTLSKLVYFEQTRKSRKVEAATNKRRFVFFDKPRQTALKRSQSLESLNTPRHTQALDAFYDFIKSDNSPIRAELKEDNLTFYSRILGGELHFMRFETRFMDRVVDIVKGNRLHHSITTIGCTGGGAYKFSSLFQDRLDITLKKMDELECLMRGLEFVLHHVVGECYTFKPDPVVPATTGGGHGGVPGGGPSGPALAALLRQNTSMPPVHSGMSQSYTGGAGSSGLSGGGAHAPPAASHSLGSSSSGYSESFAYSSGSFPNSPQSDHLGASADLQDSSSSAAHHRREPSQGAPPAPSYPNGGPAGSPRVRTTSSPSVVFGGASNASSSSSSSSSSQPPPPPPPPQPRRGVRLSPHQTGGARGSSQQQQQPDGDKVEWKYKVQRSGEHVIYPYLVCNIGSGVSILKVESPGKYCRVSGSSLGGGTYWGLCRLLTKCKTFDEVLDLAENGDPSMVDMTVGDIYGKGYDKLNLSPNVTASSFGKLVMKTEPGEGIREEDLARSLLMMITSNIGQVAYLNAVNYKATHIYFVGNFLRHNKISCRRLAFAIDYWSGSKMEALFLEHEGYFGALGAFLNSSYTEELVNKEAPLPVPVAAKLRKQQTYAPGTLPAGASRTRRPSDALRKGQSYAGASFSSREMDENLPSGPNSASASPVVRPMAPPVSPGGGPVDEELWLQQMMGSARPDSPVLSPEHMEQIEAKLFVRDSTV